MASCRSSSPSRLHTHVHGSENAAAGGPDAPAADEHLCSSGRHGSQLCLGVVGYTDPDPSPFLIPILGCLGSTAPFLKNMSLDCTGAKIIHGSSSETYLPSENSGILSGITSFLFSSNLRRVVIQVRRRLTLCCWNFNQRFQIWKLLLYI